MYPEDNLFNICGFFILWNVFHDVLSEDIENSKDFIRLFKLVLLVDNFFNLSFEFRRLVVLTACEPWAKTVYNLMEIKLIVLFRPHCYILHPFKEFLALLFIPWVILIYVQDDLKLLMKLILVDEVVFSTEKTIEALKVNAVLDQE